jgi:WD40-like Beta Propeller Repeat
MIPGNRPFARRAAIVVAALMLAIPSATVGKHFSAWSTAVLEVGVNSAQADGCPIESPNGLRLYLASTRPGAIGGAADLNDIWVARRPSKNASFGEPVHLPAPVNSTAADFCPTPLSGKRLYFVSARAVAGACGAGDIYRTRVHPRGTWEEPVNLGCNATGAGPNFAGGEFSPSIVETRHGTLLFFSSTGLDGLDQDIYVSVMRADGTFAPGSPVSELNTEFNDQMPNVSRNGREIVFSSDRPGGAGAMDVYTATRDGIGDDWSAPTNLGPNVNTVAAETRPSLSGDGKRLHFGRLGDIWVSMRSPIH